MVEKTIFVHHEKLTSLIENMFLKAGMNEKDSNYHANSIVQTNLWGIDSHGVLRIPTYIKRIKSKAININPN